MTLLFRRTGNKLFQHCFPLYRPLYSAFKAVADRSERGLIQAHIRPGMTVVDAGANIGIYSRFLARLVGASGEVHSFEPSPENFSRLRAGAQNEDNIICNPVALGAESKRTSLYLSQAVNVDHRLYPTEGESREAISVSCVALDDYFPDGKIVDFIKADIQGCELAALRGASRVIKQSPALKLLLEFWPYGLTMAGEKSRALTDLLSSSGFTVSKVAWNGRLIPLSEDDFRVDEHFFINIFAQRG